MLVEIAGFSQDMDFKDGSITNFVTLRLPSGGFVKAIVSDDGARQLVEARAALGGMQPPPPPRAPAPMPAAPHAPPTDLSNLADSSEYEDDGVVVFGGGDSSSPENPPEPFFPGGTAESPEPQNAVEHPFQHADPVVQQQMYQRHQAEQKKRAKQGPTMGRTIQKDDMGYPIANGRGGGVDTRDVVGMGNGGSDEDGVGQF